MIITEKQFIIKTLKVLKLICLCSVLSLSVRAQEHGFYIKAGSGYQFKAAPRLLYSSTNSEIVEKKDISLGEGNRVAGGIGYQFSELIGLEIEAAYLWGKNNEVRIDAEIINNIEQFGVRQRVQGRGLSINPLLTISKKIGDMTIYSKLGVSLNFLETNQDLKTTRFLPIMEVNNYSEISGGVSYGGIGTIGAKYEILKDFNLFIEWNLISLAQHNAKKIYRETQEQNNTIIYRGYEEGDFSLSNPFSSIGVNLGIQINILRK